MEEASLMVFVTAQCRLTATTSQEANAAVWAELTSRWLIKSAQLVTTYRN